MIIWFSLLWNLLNIVKPKRRKLFAAVNCKLLLKFFSLQFESLHRITTFFLAESKVSVLTGVLSVPAIDQFHFQAMELCTKWRWRWSWWKMFQHKIKAHIPCSPRYKAQKSKYISAGFPGLILNFIFLMLTPFRWRRKRSFVCFCWSCRNSL